MPRRKTVDNGLRPTLGPVICDWIEEYLVHGPGDVQGTPIVLDDEFRAFIWRCYELYPRGALNEGRRAYRQAFLSRSKGRAKSELGGMLALAEAIAPVRFDGWDANGDPVGAPITSAVVRCFATSEDQAGNTFDNALYMAENGTIYDELGGIDTGKVRINLPDGGFIVSTTSAATSKDGGKDTWDCFDEVHLWTLPRLKQLYSTVTNNLVKRRAADGWALSTSTMYAPGEGSVAEEIHKAAKNMPWILFDHKQAPLDLDITDEVALRAALIDLYGPAAEWTNIDAIVEAFHDPTRRESANRRYWLNQPWSMEERFVLPAEWDACAAEVPAVPSSGQSVVLGFDGSYNDDSTGLVGCTLGEEPYVFVIAAWERPEGAAAEGWKVPRLDVKETIRQACSTWRVTELAADPFQWIDTLEELMDEGVPVVAFPQSGVRMIPATSRLYDKIVGKTLRHDGDLRLRSHITNAVVETDSRGFRLSKKKSEFKIDLAVAAAMAVERAATAAEAPQVWSLDEIAAEIRARPEPVLAEKTEQAPLPATGQRFIPLKEMNARR